jgi:hypothetical protein
MSLVDTYTREMALLPDAHLSLIIVGGVIRLEILNADGMVDTGLTPEQAAARGHWQAVIRVEEGVDLGISCRITFGDPATIVMSDGWN